VRQWAAALALSALLAACATPRAPGPADESLAGRLSVQVAPHGGQGPRSMSATFELRGNAERGELDLSSPLGQTVAKARWAPSRAELLTSDGQRSFPDLQSLAQEALGEPLPLAALVEWLHGRPWRGAPSVRSASGFEQLGWLVDLERAAQGWIVATRSAAPPVTVRARIDDR
jgi:outer membrane lipoprotein LolB